MTQEAQQRSRRRRKKRSRKRRRRRRSFECCRGERETEGMNESDREKER